MANSHLSVPTAHNAGARLDHQKKPTKAEAAFQQEVIRLHSLAIDPRDRYYGLYPRYDELLAEHGQELSDTLTKVRADLLRSVGAERCWNWRLDLEASQTCEEYAAVRQELIEESIPSLRSDERLLRLAHGDEKQFRLLLRVVITQVLTFLEASRLPGLEWLLAESTWSA